MTDAELASLMGIKCVSYLRTTAFLHRQGPGRYSPEVHWQTMRRLDHLAMMFATIAGHYARRALRKEW